MTGGAASMQSGAISSTNYAVGNLINLQINGTWNTIVLNSTQINNGDVSAVTTINGGTQSSNGQLN
jgi:holdfast attachment protein HfaA